MSRSDVSDTIVNVNSCINKHDSYIPVHPIVNCYIDGTPLRALINTGSMRSFITDKFAAILDFDHLIRSDEPSTCTSIIGDPLHIQGG